MKQYYDQIEIAIQNFNPRINKTLKSFISHEYKTRMWTKVT